MSCTCRLEGVVKCAKKKKFDISTENSKSLAHSLNAAVDSKDPEFNKVMIDLIDTDKIEMLNTCTYKIIIPNQHLLDSLRKDLIFIQYMYQQFNAGVVIDFYVEQERYYICPKVFLE